LELFGRCKCQQLCFAIFSVVVVVVVVVPTFLENLNSRQENVFLFVTAQTNTNFCLFDHQSQKKAKTKS